jgi:isoaspartyl peptidase/L-asparaginase-like protein (Ntn-hydrolase superfamily)
MLRTLATKSVCDLIAGGMSAGSAARRVISALPAMGDESAGIIAVDRASRVGVALRNGVMPHAWYIEGDGRVVARVRAG